MPYEVEVKFPLDDRAPLERALQALGAKKAETRTEVDLYFQHPTRSFAQTDEALRVRQVGSQVFLTYKGPKIDTTTKSRTEVELELSRGPNKADDSVRFFEQLGFQPICEVRKERVLFRVPWMGKEVVACVDKVAGLGNFLELELHCEPAELDGARQTVATLAQELGLHASERRSYLELLLEREDQEEDWNET